MNHRKILSLCMCVVYCSLLVSCGSSSAKNTNQINGNESVTKVFENEKNADETDTNENNNSQEEKKDDVSASGDIFAMDTYMTVLAYGSHADEAVKEALKEIERLDGMLSATDKDSEIYELNIHHGGHLSDDVSYLIERSKEVYESTGGKFNIAIYPIVEIWGFASGNYRVPNQDEIDALQEDIDFSKIEFEKNSKSLVYGSEKMKIDLGGIAKGYTSARIMDIFRNLGVTSGIVNLGGNVQVLGMKPDGSEWKVAIQNPVEEESYIGVVKVHDKAVITSGGYERYFEENGVRYHHIIDPDTGFPANTGLISVSIICADGTLADCLSTSLFIMGKDGAIEYWKMHQGEFDMILYTEDEELFITEGIADSFISESKITVISE